MHKLPHSSFSTRNLRPDERFDAWCEDLSVIFDVKNPSCENGKPFHADFDVYNLGQSIFCKLDSAAAQYTRSRKKIAGDGLDGILLQLFVEGGVQFGSGKTTNYGRRGDIVVFDLSKPVDNFNSTFKHLTIMLPRDAMDAAIPDIGRWHGLALPRGNPAVRLLRRHIISSFEMAPQFDITAGHHIQAATISLATAAMCGKPILAHITEQPHTASVITHQLKRYIRDNLKSDQISPEALARAFGISRAKIYRLMEPFGGVATYIRQLRLHRSMADLCDPLLAHLNVSEIAYRSGFNHLTTFNRSFRDTFGISPSDARRKDRLFQRSKAASGAKRTSPGSEKQHQEWIRTVGM